MYGSSRDGQSLLRVPALDVALDVLVVGILPFTLVTNNNNDLSNEMGNFIQSSSRLELEKQFRVVRQTQEITLLEELNTDNEFCLKCFTFNSQEGLEACVEKMHFKKRANHQHLLGIHNVTSRSENTFCSNIHKVFVVIEYPFRTLNEEIEERKRNWDYFSESEIWSILYSCAMGLNYLYSTNLTHESLTSNRVYIEKGGLIKVSDPGLMSHNSNLITYITKSNKEHVYLSPEQLAQLPSQETGGYSAELSDVFTLGLIILQAIHLQGMEDIYDNTINYRSLAGKIAAIGGRYTSKLRTILEKMLTNRPEERISFDEIEVVIDNDNFDEEDGSVMDQSRREASVGTYRKPLDSLPSNGNFSTEKRNDGMRPSKAPVVKKEVEKEYHTMYQPVSQYSSQVVSEGNPNNYQVQIKETQASLSKYPMSNYQPLPNKKFQPLILPQSPSMMAPSSIVSPTTTASNFYSRYASNNLNSDYMSNGSYVSQYKFPNLPVSLGGQYDSYSSKHLPMSEYVPKYPQFTTFSPLPPLFPPIQTPSTPSSVTKTSFQAFPALELNYSSFPVRPNDISQPRLDYQTSPVQRLATHPIAESEDFNTQQPNSTIVEVTETEVSGIESPEKEEFKPPALREQLQYVNEESESGSRYEGYKLNGMKHGFGRFYYQDGGYYEGEWKNNKMNGFAKLYYQTGDIAYEGYWLNDKLHGKGKVFNDNPKDLTAPFNFKDFTGLDDHWLFYDGEFSMDAKQGLGTIKLTNGEIFEGEFDKDVIQGKGKFYTLDGRIINGLWKENKLVDSS